MSKRRAEIRGILFFLVAISAPCLAQAAEEQKRAASETPAKTKLVEVSLANGAVSLKLPADWTAPEQVRSRIVEREFTVPKADGDQDDGRLTMMRSGGSVKLNVDRWFGQFSQPDGKATKDVAKVLTKEINEQEVTIVDVSGTFSERMGGGPFAPGKTVKREGYRMLGGIVQTKASGQYFFKLYGPAKTIGAAEKDFLNLLESIESTGKRSN